MTRQSMQEYVRAIRERYWQANKEGKTKILDEFTKTTGLHRKGSIRLLNKESPSHGSKKGGRPRKYSHEMVEVLKIAWEAEDTLCPVPRRLCNEKKICVIIFGNNTMNVHSII